MNEEVYYRNRWKSIYGYDPMDSEPKTYCPICGEEIGEYDGYCSDCKRYIIESLQEMLHLSDTDDHYVLKEAVEDMWGVAFGEEKER